MFGKEGSGNRRRRRTSWCGIGRVWSRKSERPSDICWMEIDELQSYQGVEGGGDGRFYWECSFLNFLFAAMEIGGKLKTDFLNDGVLHAGLLSGPNE